jgi:hypothetical protein
MNHAYFDEGIAILCFTRKKHPSLMHHVFLLFQGVVLDQETFYADIAEADREVSKTSDSDSTRKTHTLCNW